MEKIGTRETKSEEPNYEMYQFVTGTVTALSKENDIQMALWETPDEENSIKGHWVGGRCLS